MSVVLTIMNMKGGVGKTTTALHIGGAAARYQLGAAKPRKVLLIDYDPQFNLSQALLPAKTYFDMEAAKKTVLSVLMDDDTELDPYKLQVPGNLNPPSVKDISRNLWKSGGASLDLVPSTLDLMYVALGQANTSVKPIIERFSKFIQECRSIYDLIIIDCHPAGSLFTQTSLQNSDHVLIPVFPQKYAVRGIGLMLKFIQAKKIGVTGPVPHILFNAVPRYAVSTEEKTIRADAKLQKYCLGATLKKFKALSDPEGGLGLVWSSSKPYSSEALTNVQIVAKEVMDRIGA